MNSIDRTYRSCKSRLTNKRSHYMWYINTNHTKPIIRSDLRSQPADRCCGASKRVVRPPYLRAAEYIIQKISVRTIREKACTASEPEVHVSTARDLRLVNREVRESRRQICASNSRKMYALEPSNSYWNHLFEISLETTWQLRSRRNFVKIRNVKDLERLANISLKALQHV